MESLATSIENPREELATGCTRASHPQLLPTFSESSDEVYKSVSRTAIASASLGFLGLTSFPVLPMIALSLLGLAFAIIAFRSFAKFPDELQGRPIAFAGATLCVLTLLLAPAYHTYVYLTEVPDGYARTDFALLQSALGKPDLPPAEAIKLDGQKVFIKGYIHPTSMDTMQSKRFVLVPDLGTCCFGGQPPLTHMIEVSLIGDQYARKSYRKQRLAGTLYVNPNLKPIDGLTGVFYQLRADIIK